MLCWNSGEDTHPHPAFCTPPSASTGSPSTFARAHFQRLHSHSPATDRSLGPPSLWTCPHAKLFFEHAREKKITISHGNWKVFLSAIGFCHLRIKCKIHAATRNQAGYMHSCDWLYFTCVENKSHVRTRCSHMWFVFHVSWTFDRRMTFLTC